LDRTKHINFEWKKSEYGTIRKPCYAEHRWFLDHHLVTIMIFFPLCYAPAEIFLQEKLKIFCDSKIAPNMRLWFYTKKFKISSLILWSTILHKTLHKRCIFPSKITTKMVFYTKTSRNFLARCARETGLCYAQKWRRSYMLRFDLDHHPTPPRVTRNRVYGRSLKI